MKVLIDIAGFVNRGDQLMFSAIAQAVHAHLPDAELVVPHKLLDRPELRRLSDLPFRALADSRKLGRRVTNGLKWTLSRLGLCAAPVGPSQIDLVLHAPGFRYSDAFPLRRKDSLKKEVAYFRAFSKRGRKVVFLPQAFGPFETDGARQRMGTLYPFADTLYARDTTSLAYLKALFPNAANISLAPDFTCACRGVMPAAASATGERYGVIVPNVRMVSHTALGETAYLGFLREVAALFREGGLRVVLLNHEGESDRELIERLKGLIGGPVACFNDVTGLECKGVIGGAAIVVTSRFHGAVSGLSQGVPTLMTGWSHKYRELAADFGRPDNCLDPANPDTALATVANALRHPSSYAAEAERVASVTARTAAMWEEVFAVTSGEAAP